MRNIVLASLASSLILLNSAAIASADENCGKETLQGSYIFSANGIDKTQIAYAGMSYYDGNGGTVTTIKNADNSNTNLRGKYRITRNCRAEIAYTNGRRVTLFVAPTGDETVFVVTSGPIIASNTRRVSKTNLLSVKP